MCKAKPALRSSTQLALKPCARVLLSSKKGRKPVVGTTSAKTDGVKVREGRKRHQKLSFYCDKGLEEQILAVTQEPVLCQF